MRTWLPFSAPAASCSPINFLCDDLTVTPPNHLLALVLILVKVGEILKILQPQQQQLCKLTAQLICCCHFYIAAAASLEQRA